MSDELLNQLMAATSDEEREWISLNFFLQTLDPELREAVWAAAIPHWFDADFLSALLSKPKQESYRLFESLKKIPFVELFPNRGYNIHERNRFLLLQRLWIDNPARLRELSRLAADYCAQYLGTTVTWDVERIYQMLLAQGPDAVEQFTYLAFTYFAEYEYENVDVLVRTIWPEAAAGIIPEIMGWVHYFRGALDSAYSRFQPAKTNLEMALSLSGEDSYLTALALSELGGVFRVLSQNEFARKVLEEALQINKQIGSRLGEANTLASLGELHYYLDEYEPARKVLEEALRVYKQIENRLGEANTLASLGDIHYGLGEYESARKLLEEALHVYKQTGDRIGEASTLTSLGNIHNDLGEYEPARKLLEEALHVYKQIGSRLGEANTLASLGDMHNGLGEYESARKLLEEALQIHRQISNRLGEANVLASLGDIHRLLNEYDSARKLFEEALQIYRQIGSRLGEANVLASLGNIHRSLGEYDSARKLFEEALQIHRDIGNESEEAFLLGELKELVDPMEDL